MTWIEEDAQNFSQYLCKQGAAGQIGTSLKNYDNNLQNKKRHIFNRATAKQIKSRHHSQISAGDINNEEHIRTQARSELKPP